MITNYQISMASFDISLLLVILKKVHHPILNIVSWQLLKCSFFCFLPTSQIVPSIFFHLFHFHLHLTAKFLTSAFGFHSMLFHFLLWVLPATQRHHVCFLFFFPSSVSYFSQKYSLLDTVFWKSSSTLLFPNLSQYIYPYTEPDF